MRGMGIRTTGRKKGMHFMLIPLVDVIFLLLTFFMLSSRLAPYSALTLAGFRSPDPAVAAAQSPSAAQPDVILTVSAGEVRANGATMPLSAFQAEADRLKADGANSVVVFVRSSATTQDIVSVLEVLKRSAFASVNVRTKQG